MDQDETEIRELVRRWMEATKAGDVDGVLCLMTDDAIFLVAGQPPMTRSDFAAAARAQAGPGGPTIDGSSDIRELEVHGDLAYLWQRLTVDVTLAEGGARTRRVGHTLTIFRKVDGKWLLSRDANMLVQEL